VNQKLNKMFKFEPIYHINQNKKEFSPNAWPLISPCNH